MEIQDSKPQLNLARKLRSKQFDQIIGQELSVRMLKNSLYLNQFFPVYLFSGQRGCGKTTTARVFASALNCEKLSEFQKNPRLVSVPCLECSSCVAMAAGNHPDFIEFDAASHTGVDNVRTIIEAASLLPVMGNKKLYLIDEAHMLSKAAFNAFLKLLEEPPPSVIFMLATTDPQKIIDTVRSRCFQIFFTAIDSTTLVDYLQKVCHSENINAQKDALTSIVKETEGSARDALNLLEQVRFASGTVTQQAVEKVLGRMSENSLLTLFECLVERDMQKLVLYLESINFEAFSPLIVWQSFQELVRSALFTKYGTGISQTIQDKKRFQALVHAVTSQQLNFYLQKLYDYELILIKTTVQHALLEMLFIELANQGASLIDAPLHVLTQSIAQVPKVTRSSDSVIEDKVEQKKTSEVSIEKNSVSSLQKSGQEEEHNRQQQWNYFVQQMQQMSDPLLVSIFKQAEFGAFNEEKKELKITFTQASGLFDDWMNDTKDIWMKLVSQIFGPGVNVVPVFLTGAAQQAEAKKLSGAHAQHNQASSLGSSEVNLPKRETVPVQQPLVQKQQFAGTNMPNRIVSPAAQSRASLVNVTDKDTWKTANQLLDAFGGTVVEDTNNEKV
ncbi:DNA polymerase III subunit gamma/tau [Candidatus Babeliales bacterium]|nr:DNA polymerase III subunit gamma/tau [Candidatus Babeliales bacterium]